MAEQGQQSSAAQGRAPRADFNVMELEAGTRIRLVGEATAEVVSNPRDGMWVLVRYLSSPGSPGQEGMEDLAFAEDILEVL